MPAPSRVTLVCVSIFVILLALLRTPWGKSQAKSVIELLWAFVDVWSIIYMHLALVICGAITVGIFSYIFPCEIKTKGVNGSQTSRVQYLVSAMKLEESSSSNILYNMFQFAIQYFLHASNIRLFMFTFCMLIYSLLSIFTPINDSKHILDGTNFTKVVDIYVIILLVLVHFLLHLSNYGKWNVKEHPKYPVSTKTHFMADFISQNIPFQNKLRKEEAPKPMLDPKKIWNFILTHVDIKMLLLCVCWSILTLHTPEVHKNVSFARYLACFPWNIALTFIYPLCTMVGVILLNASVHSGLLKSTVPGEWKDFFTYGTCVLAIAWSKAYADRQSDVIIEQSEKNHILFYVLSLTLLICFSGWCIIQIIILHKATMIYACQVIILKYKCVNWFKASEELERQFERIKQSQKPEEKKSPGDNALEHNFGQKIKAMVFQVPKNLRNKGPYYLFFRTLFRDNYEFEIHFSMDLTYPDYLNEKKEHSRDRNAALTNLANWFLQKTILKQYRKLQWSNARIVIHIAGVEVCDGAIVPKGDRKTKSIQACENFEMKFSGNYYPNRALAALIPALFGANNLIPTDFRDEKQWMSIFSQLFRQSSFVLELDSGLGAPLCINALAFMKHFSSQQLFVGCQRSLHLGLCKIWEDKHNENNLEVFMNDLEKILNKEHEGMKDCNPEILEHIHFFIKELRALLEEINDADGENITDIIGNRFVQDDMDNFLSSLAEVWNNLSPLLTLFIQYLQEKIKDDINEIVEEGGGLISLFWENSGPMVKIIREMAEEWRNKIGQREAKHKIEAKNEIEAKHGIEIKHEVEAKHGLKNLPLGEEQLQQEIKRLKERLKELEALVEVKKAEPDLERDVVQNNAVENISENEQSNNESDSDSHIPLA